MNLYKFSLLLISAVSLISCSSADKEKDPFAPDASDNESSHEAEQTKDQMAQQVAALQSDWDYSTERGPTKWSEISDDYKTCGLGELQSPIDLRWQKPQAATRSIEFDYKDVPLQVVDNGHTIQVKFPEGSSAYFAGKQYQLKYLEFHTSSEHTLSGNQLPMEAQLVHKNELGQISIVSFFLIEGRFNAFIEKIWSHIPEQKNAERVVPNLLVNAKDILPAKMTYYFYIGSLTQPPCTEGVRWQVLNTPVEMSREQIVQFRSKYSNNARPVQPLNSRNVINY